MKKIIIIAALVLASGFTAFSLTKTDSKAQEIKIKSESANFAAKDSSTPKADIGTAD